MNYRLNKFLSREDFDADTTKVIDINIQDVISNIVIFYEITNAAAAMTAHPAAGITQVELVDGSDVLFSLDGYEIEALDWYHQKGHFPANWNWAMNGGNIQRVLRINFGRHLWDRELAFDPKKFNNPQLRISLDIDAGGNAGTHIFLTCWANLFDEQPAELKGFLMSKEIKEWTMADNTHEYTDLPLDYPYRNLYLRAFSAGREPNSNVENIKLSEDQDKRIPYNCGGQEILRYVQENYPPVEEAYFYAFDTANRYLYIAPSAMVTAYAVTWAQVGAVQNPALYDGDGGRLKTIATANPQNNQVFVRGHVPHSVFEIPFGLRDTIEDWYDVRRLGSLRADIEGANAATGYLFVQQYRPY